MTAAIVIGAGPAGLMAAERLSAAGVAVTVFDAMPSPARKFLRAGVGGLNLTHSEAAPDFLARYGAAAPRVAGWLAELDATGVRAWAEGLGVATFVGSSGRVFPQQMKAAPLLRAWLARLATQGVALKLRHRWLGWDEAGALRFAAPAGDAQVGAGETAATVLALGGASWSRLGSDGAWLPYLRARGVRLNPFAPANVGITLDWSAHLRERHAHAPIKNVVLHCGAEQRRGDLLLTPYGLEGGPAYALGAAIRAALDRHGAAPLTLDFVPEKTLAHLQRALSAPRGRDSLANHLRRCIGLTGVKAALLREGASAAELADATALAQRLKALPLRATGLRPLEEAISSAGGIALDELDDGLMLRRLPGVFCAGEMLDWEAPTGGYLLTAALASGARAARGVIDYLGAAPRPRTAA